MSNEDYQLLVQAFLRLDGAGELGLFLRDLMTETELQEFTKRWKAARMLNDGQPYTAIEKVTGLSSATIARVSKWLQSGTGGYRLVLDRFASEPPVVQAAEADSSEPVPAGDHAHSEHTE